MDHQNGYDNCSQNNQIQLLINNQNKKWIVIYIRNTSHFFNKTIDKIQLNIFFLFLFFVPNIQIVLLFHGPVRDEFNLKKTNECKLC